MFPVDTRWWLFVDTDEPAEAVGFICSSPPAVSLCFFLLTWLLALWLYPRVSSVAVCRRDFGAVILPLPSAALCGASVNLQEPFPSGDAVPLPSASVLFEKGVGLVYLGPDFFFISRLRCAEKSSREPRAVPLPLPWLECPPPTPPRPTPSCRHSQIHLSQLLQYDDRLKPQLAGGVPLGAVLLWFGLTCNDTE